MQEKLENDDFHKNCNWKSAAKSNGKLVNQKYATPFCSYLRCLLEKIFMKIRYWEFVKPCGEQVIEVELWMENVVSDVRCVSTQIHVSDFLSIFRISKGHEQQFVSHVI